MSYYEKVQERKRENLEFIKSLKFPELCQELEASGNDGHTSLSDNTTKNLPRCPKRSVGRPSKRASSCDLTPIRKSKRLLKEEAPIYTDIEEIDKEIEKESRRDGVLKKPEKIKRENTFGAIPNVPVGTEFSQRLEASHAGIHRPTVAGIHGNPALGCYSIALSGGYEDDVDLGESFIYTGEGGRDLKGTKANPKNLRTAAQSKDQVLARGNLALSKNVENNLPVRVLRGYKLNSKYAPEDGYRYDGLYRVVKYYRATGKSGFSVYKFKFERLENQEPAPWSEEFQNKRSENLENVEISEKENIPNMEMEVNEVPEHPMTSEDEE